MGLGVEDEGSTWTELESKVDWAIQGSSNDNEFPLKRFHHEQNLHNLDDSGVVPVCHFSLIP